MWCRCNGSFAGDPVPSPGCPCLLGLLGQLVSVNVMRHFCPVPLTLLNAPTLPSSRAVTTVVSEASGRVSRSLSRGGGIPVVHASLNTSLYHFSRGQRLSIFQYCTSFCTSRLGGLGLWARWIHERKGGRVSASCRLPLAADSDALRPLLPLSINVGCRFLVGGLYRPLWPSGT